MNNRKAAIAFILSASFVVAASAATRELGDDIKFDWTYSEAVVFSAEHDPGDVYLKDGRILSIWFQAIPVEETFNWQAGRKLTISYAPDSGLWLVDDATGKKDRILAGLGDKQHPLSILLDKCASQNETTYGDKACTYLATKQWDAEMTRAYKSLLGLVPKEKRSQLIEAQRAWIKFRDAQERAIGLVYEKQGTMWGIYAYDEDLDLTREQAGRLWGFLANTGADPGDFVSDAEEKAETH